MYTTSNTQSSLHCSLHTPTKYIKYAYDEWTCPSLSFGRVHYDFRGIRSDFESLFHFLMKFLCTNRIAPDGMPRSEASHLGLFCLPMSHKRDARLRLVI